MVNISVEIILFIVLGLVFIVDFFLKGIKKSPSKKKEGITKFIDSSTNNASSFSYKILQFFIERPRNIALYFTSIWVFKILINATLFKFYWDRGEIVRKEPDFYIVNEGRYGDFDFGDYIRYSFEINFESFLYSFIALTFIVWQFNPFIKKR